MLKLNVHVRHSSQVKGGLTFYSVMHEWGITTCVQFLCSTLEA